MSRELPTARALKLQDESPRDGAIGGLDDAALLDCFAESGEGMAFAALVERHGPMVLRVCRSVLDDPHEAEDAYQATFLLLALRARSIRRRGSVASWLFGVARRVSTKVRRAEARRRDRDRLAASQRVRAVADAPADPLPEIFEELDRLPDRLRDVVVLCDLEDHSYASAAAQLGCPERTVHSRLYRARRRLRDRLTRRGLAPGLVAGALSGMAARRVVASTALKAETLAGLAAKLAAGDAMAGVVPASIQLLIQGALRSMLMSKIYVVTSLATILGGAAIVASAVALDGTGQEGRPGEVLFTRPASGRVLEGHPTAVLSIAFRPDGGTLASGDARKLIKFWKTASGEETGEYRIETESDSNHAAVMELEFAPDGRTLATASDDGYVRLWDVDSGKALVELNTNFFVSDLAFRPDGRTLAWGPRTPWHGVQAENGWPVIVLWDVETRRERTRLAGHEAGITAVTFSPDGRWLASCSEDRTVRLWEVDSGASKILQDIPEPLRAMDVAFSTDGRIVAAALGDDRSAGRDRTGMPVREQPPEGWTPGVVRIWDVVSGEVRADLRGHEDRVRAIAFSPDGSLLASGGYDATVRLWDITSGAERAVLRGHGGNVYDVAFAPDGRTLATCGIDMTVRLWELGPILDR